MTDTETHAPAAAAQTDLDASPPPAKQPRQAGPNAPGPGSANSVASRGVRSYPTLEKLAALYPQLFGEVFLPLKRGIFQDLLAAHPEVFEREALKDALAQHTRSTRYLTGVASGWQRHDLQGQAVEAMAPEHVHHALLEVFRRRQGRTREDLRPKLRARIVQAFEESGLASADYAELVRSRDEAANAVLDEALADAAAQSAKDEALLRAFEAGSQTVEEFAEMYGLDAKAAARSLERARRGKEAVVTAPATDTPVA
jgi:sRNA-binding protein